MNRHTPNDWRYLAGRLRVSSMSQHTQAQRSKDPEAAEALSDLMSEISEEYYCAGWLIDLEWILWGMLEGGSREFGMGTVTEEEIAKLRGLSERAGGWWVWDDVSPSECETFLTLDEWAAYRAERADRR